MPDAERSALVERQLTAEIVVAYVRRNQLDAKMEKRQEAKTEHAALRGVVGGMSHTLADHE
jgi:predicted transcriptional regulator